MFVYRNIKYKHCFSFWALVFEKDGFTWIVNTVLPRLTSDPANEFFG